MKIILASASPRRKELLGLMGLSFEVCPSTADEHIPLCEPADYVSSLSLLKASEVALKHPGALVIGADTVVVSEGEIFGKPKDQLDAVRMLRQLSGNIHSVYTGVSVVRGDENGILYEDTRVTSTQVWFRDLDDEEIERYVLGGEPMDKAGAYAIQGQASMMVDRIEGDYFNVVGLPVCLLGEMLKRAGVEVI